MKEKIDPVFTSRRLVGRWYMSGRGLLKGMLEGWLRVGRRLLEGW